MGKFTVTLITPAGIRNANPFGINDLEISEEIDNDTIFYKTREIKGSLVFVGEDYLTLKRWETSDRRCHKTTVIIYENCSTQTEVVRTVVGADEISWNNGHNTCTMQIDVKQNSIQQYNILKDVEYNLFEISGPIRETWQIHLPSFPAFGPYQNIPYYGSSFYSPIPPYLSTVYNGITLKNALNGLLQRIFQGIFLKSSFFGWNTPQVVIGDSLWNTTFLRKLLLVQSSDIYERNARAPWNILDPATKMTTTADKIISSLCFLFHLKCDVIGSEFIIEHVSYFATLSPEVTDATIELNGKLNSALLSNYAYQSEGRFAGDEYVAENIGLVSADLNSTVGMQLNFKTICDTCNSNIIETNVKQISLRTDAFCGFNDTQPGAHDALGDPVLQTQYARMGLDITTLNASISLIAVDPSNNINYFQAKGIGISSYDPEAVDCPQNYLDNAPLAWNYLFNYLYRFNTSFPSIANSLIVDPVTKIPIQVSAQQKRFKFQQAVKIKTCCNSDSIINTTVITELGEGVVMKTKKAFGTQYIEADVYFDAVTGDSLAAPIAEPVKYYTYVDEAIDTLADSLPTLVSGGLTAYAEIVVTAFGGLVTIQADGNFIYIPHADFDGLDTFDYTIINNSGLTDTNTVTIAVRLTNFFLYIEHLITTDGNSVAPNWFVNDRSNILYFKEADKSIEYDVTGMNYTIYMHGEYNNFVDPPFEYNWNFIAAGMNEKIPDASGLVGAPAYTTPYSKVVVANSAYTILY